VCIECQILGTTKADDKFKLNLATQTKPSLHAAALNSFLKCLYFFNDLYSQILENLVVSVGCKLSKPRLGENIHVKDNGNIESSYSSIYIKLRSLLQENPPKMLITKHENCESFFTMFI